MLKYKEISNLLQVRTELKKRWKISKLQQLDLAIKKTKFQQQSFLYKEIDLSFQQS